NLASGRRLFERTMDSGLVGLGRLELPTSRLSSARSNQLSYKPKLTQPYGWSLTRPDPLAWGIRPSPPDLPGARPGGKRNESGAPPQARPDRPVVPSDPKGGKRSCPPA